MPANRIGALSRIPRRHSGHGMAALALLVLAVSCASDKPATVPEQALTRQPQRAAVEDGEERVFIALPTRFPSAKVSEKAFTEALVSLVLNMPLPVTASQPLLYPGRRLALASGSLSGEQWRSEFAQDYRHFCERRGTPGDCLNRFDDGPELDADDKRSIALALAVGPALDGVDAEVRAMLSPTRLLTMISISITGYMALLVAPEPISKGVATVATLLLWSYLGWELWDLIEAYLQLSEESSRATAFGQLREAGERFAKVIGPNSVRILVLLGTAAIGGTLSLSSKAPKLPGFGQAETGTTSSSNTRPT